MKRRRSCAAAVVAVLAMMSVATSPAAAAPATSPLTVPIAGTAANALGETVKFAGSFTLQRFTVVDGQLQAVGQLTGTLTNQTTGAVQQVSQIVTLPVAGAAGTCRILDLTLGPLDLDLLGLVVHLDQVNLTIDAQRGPGNLLGNLLCGIAGLLDSGAGANPLATALNQLIRLL